MKLLKPIRRIFWTIICGTVIISACSGLPTQATPTAEPSQTGEIQPLVSATGKVVPARWSRLSINVIGVVEEILVEEGDQVKEGQVLLRLQGKEDLQSAIEAARFEVASSQKALDDLYKNADATRTSALEAIALRQRQYRDALYQLDNFTVPQPQVGLTAEEGLKVMKEKLDQARTAFEPYKYYPSTDETRKDLKEDLDEAQADYNSAVKRLEYETELAVAEANLKKAKDDYQTWKDEQRLEMWRKPWKLEHGEPQIVTWQLRKRGLLKRRRVQSLVLVRICGYSGRGDVKDLNLRPFGLPTFEPRRLLSVSGGHIQRRWCGVEDSVLSRRRIRVRVV